MASKRMGLSLNLEEAKWLYEQIWRKNPDGIQARVQTRLSSIILDLEDILNES